MKSTKSLIKTFGNPLTNRRTFESTYMVMWNVPTDILQAIPVIPKRIYVNKLIVKPLEATLRRLIEQNVHSELKTFDGCYNPRFIRGSTSIPSRHSWGLAIDFNAAWNPLGQEKPNWSTAFIDVWKTAGWTFGGDWLSRPDPMHFQWDNF